MKALAVFALAAGLLCGRVDVARSAVGFTYSYPCKDELRFDTSGLECRRCDHNEVVLGQDECGCVDGTTRSFEAGGVFSSFPCKECPNGTVPSSLGTYCVQCDGSSGPYWLPARIDSTGCSCEQSGSTNAIATELGLSGAPIWQDGVWLKRCVVCPEGTIADAALQKCRHCPWPRVLDGEGECICPMDAPGAACDTAEDLQRVAEGLGVSLVGAYEIKAFDVMSASQVGQELTIRNSKPFVELLPAAAIGCHDHGNRTACNSLANLCVLAGYDSGTAACQLYERLRRSRELEQYHAAEVSDPSQGWALTLPWLTYTEQDPELVLEADDVRLKLTFGDEEWRSGQDGEFSKVNNITLLLSETTLQGEWLGLKELTTELQVRSHSASMLKVCGVRVEEGDHWRKVGFAYLNDCELSVQELLRLSHLQGGSPRFFDIFLKDGADRLYPVPIIDTSLRQRGRRVNQDADRPDELVRRLVVLDAVSLQEEGGQLQAVSYPQQLRLTVQMHDEGGGRIHPPALTVEYRAVSMEVPATAEVHKARFEVAYKNSSKTRNEFWEAWEIMLGVFVGLLGGVYAVGRVITKCVLVPPVVADAPNGQLNRLLDLVADVAAAVSFWLTAVLLCLSFYSLSFFKLESEVHTLLPENNDLEDFRATAIAAVVLASIAMAYTIYKQVNLAVLFIDWAHAPGLIGREGSDLKEAPVSCWRLLFVANELNELQTVRLTSPALTLMFVLFVLSGLGLEDEAMMSRGDWEYSKHPHGRKSILLAFGINTSFYLLGVLIQILYRYVIGHRFVSHPLEEYINLLYLANVSCLIYDSQEWSGFYLHGRNQMDCVDTSLSVLNQKLLQEGRGLVAERGLQSTAAIKDLRMNQRFLFHQAGEADLRRPLSELCAHAARKFEQESSQKTRLWAGFHGPDNDAGDAELLRSLEEKQHQVKRAIELIQQQPSRVREPQPLQALLGLPSRDEVGTRDTVLVHDFHNRWARTMWYGQEPLLVLFELLFFCCVDMDLSNTALSATLTFFATSFVSWLRRHYGEKNLARKTMIDQHFLI